MIRPMSCARLSTMRGTETNSGASRIFWTSAFRPVPGRDAFPEPGEIQLALDGETHLLREVHEQADAVFLAHAVGRGRLRHLRFLRVVPERVHTEQLPPKHAEEGHLLLAVQPVGRLLAGVDDPRAQLLQLLVNLPPVVAELFEYVGEGLRERRLEIRIVVELDVEMVADRVLDLRRPRLRAIAPGHVLDEILVEDGDGRHLGIDPPGFQVFVRDGPQLRRNALHAEPPVPKVLARQYVDLGQGLIVPAHNRAPASPETPGFRHRVSFLNADMNSKRRSSIVEDVEETHRDRSNRRGGASSRDP